MLTQVVDDVIKIGAGAFSDLMQISAVLGVPNDVLINPVILGRYTGAAWNEARCTLPGSVSCA